jgi:hypothetical protein
MRSGAVQPYVAAITFSVFLPPPFPVSAADASAPLAATARGASSHVPVLVEFEGPPAARAYGDSQRNRPEAAQADLAPILLARFGATEIYRVTKALNAIAIFVERSEIPAIAKLPGVRSARILRPEFPSNATSVPFIGAPPLWNGSSGPDMSLTGAGVRIGIIDTGIDYIHSDFGGTGLLAD